MKGKLAIYRSPRRAAASKLTRLRCSHRPETVCRFHGARGGGRKGASNGAYRDRLHTAEAVAERRALAALLRRARTRVAGMGDGRRGQAPRQGSAGRLPAVPS